VHRQSAIVILFSEGTYRRVNLEGGFGGRDSYFERFGQHRANVVNVQRSALGAIDENRLAFIVEPEIAVLNVRASCRDNKT
jgi:hypothetical protein